MQERFKQISWLMIGLLVIMVLPAFLTLTKPVNHELIRVKSTSLYYSAIPKRAVALSSLTSYKDKALTKKANSITTQTQLKIKTLINKGNKKLFVLENGTYLLANTKTIGSDIVLTVKKLVTTVYVTSTVNILYSPFTTYDHQVYTTISGNQSLQTLKKATTHWGVYYEVSFNGGYTGWISSKDISLEDPKLLSLQDMLNQNFDKSSYSIAVKELDSNFTVGVNLNKKMYSASLSKLPILYWTQKRINSGYALPSDQLKYTSSVNAESWGAFNPSGTGELPKSANNHTYSLMDIINQTAKESDNVGSNLLAYYETNKFSPTYRAAINKIAGADWDPVQRNVSAEMVACMIEALYDAGGICFNALFNTAYDNSRIEAGVPDNIKVAHKIGIADEYNHDAAIVFATQPYILVIETTNDTPNTILTRISKMVYGVLE